MRCKMKVLGYLGLALAGVGIAWGAVSANQRWNQVRGNASNTGFAEFATVGSTAEVQWTDATRGPSASPVVFGDKLYVPKGDLGLEALDVRTGVRAWRFNAEAGERFNFGPACAAQEDGTPFVCAVSTTATTDVLATTVSLLRDDGATATAVWRQTLSGIAPRASDVTLANKKLFISIREAGSGNYGVLSLNGQDGSLHYLKLLPGIAVSGGKLAADRGLQRIYVASDAGVLALDDQGNEVWRIPGVVQSFNTPLVVDSVAHRLYVNGSRGGHTSLQCYDAQTGAPVWDSHDTGFDTTTGNEVAPVLAEGVLYAVGVTPTEFVIAALNASTGGLVWTVHPLEGPRRLLRTGNGKLWAQGAGALSCRSAADGSLERQYNLGGPFGLDFCADRRGLYVVDSRFQSVKLRD